MSRLHRRVVALTLALAVVAVAVVIAVQPSTPPTWTLRVMLGVGDTKPTDWSGTVAADGGNVVQIAGWRFEAGDKVDGTAGWTCKTRDYIAFGKRDPIQLADGSPRVPRVKQPWPNGVTIRLKGNAPKLTLKLAQGEVKFDASTIAAGEPLTALAGRVMIERLPATSIVRQPAKPKAANPVQDDYPASGCTTNRASSISRGSPTIRRKTASCWSSAMGPRARGRRRRRSTRRATTSASRWRPRTAARCGSSGPG